MLSVTTNDPAAQTIHTHTVTLRVGSERITVYVIALAGSEPPANTNIDQLTLWVDSPDATPANQQALIRVAQAYLRACYLDVAPVHFAALSGLNRWQEDTWHSQVTQKVKIGYADGRSYEVGPTPETTKPSAGVMLAWPAGRSRCQYGN